MFVCFKHCYDLKLVSFLVRFSMIISVIEKTE